MGIKEISEQESNNTSAIVLRKEGLFWRAYELSAYLFINIIKDCTPVRRHYKIIDREVVYVGFPDTILEQILSKASSLHNSKVNRDNKIIIVQLSNPDTSGFDNWKNNLPLNESAKTAEKPEKDIMEKIRSFPVISKTPLDAQLFIIQLQNEINGTL